MIGRMLVFTGDGKGKTTAALGMVLRAAGHGQRVLVLQFVKGECSTGEIAACKQLSGVKILQTGLGFIPPEDAPQFAEHRRAAERGLALAREALTCGRWDLVVLDEVCLAVARHLLCEEAVLAALGERVRSICVVLTGRGAPAGVLAQADTVTEMRCLAHGLRQGICAQPGVEY